MSSDITVDAVRLALGINETQARLASRNIAGANDPGASALRADFAQLQALLGEAAQGGGPDLAERVRAAAASGAQTAQVAASGPIQLDEQVADIVAASVNYQSLSEALSRHFGLLRLSIAGRS